MKEDKCHCEKRLEQRKSEWCWDGGRKKFAIVIWVAELDSLRRVTWADSKEGMQISWGKAFQAKGTASKRP